MTHAFSRRALLGAAAFVLLAPAARAEAKPLRLLAFGDSLIHGYGLAPDESLPAQLETALQASGHTVTVINAGNSGDTTASGLARLDWTLGEPADAVLLALGANDGLRGLPPDEMERNLRSIVEGIQAKGLPILLAGMMAPRNWGADYAAEYDAVFPRVAEDYGLLFYPFLLQDVALEPALNQNDGIHPNAAGVAVIVENLLPQAEALLARAAAEGSAS